VVNDSDRIDLDQVAWRHRRYPDHYAFWLVISEQGYLGRFDDRHVFVALMIDDIDGDLADLLMLGAGSSKRTAEIGKRQARLSRNITIANQLTVYVFELDDGNRSLCERAYRGARKLSSLTQSRRARLSSVRRARHGFLERCSVRWARLDEACILGHRRSGHPTIVPPDFQERTST